MIAIAQSVWGVAGTASVIAATILGKRSGSPAVLAQGLLGSAAAAVYTPADTTGSEIETIFLVNTSGSTVSGIQISLAGTTYPITGVFSLGAYGWAVIPTNGLATIYTATGATPTVGMLAADGSVVGATAGAQVFTLGVTSNGDLTIADAKNVILNATTGSKIGTAITQKLGVYNATPIAQRAGAAQAAVVTTAATQTTPFGFATGAQADAIITLVNELRAWAVVQGWIKGAA